MLMRCRHGRRVQTYLKISTCLLLAICYCTFLFRESLNALEHNNNSNKDKTTITNVIINNNNIELSASNALEQRNNIKLLLKQQRQTSTIKHEIEATASTLNPVYDYSEEQHRATEQDLQRRHEHLTEICAKYKLQSLYPPNPWEFFISPGHNLVWCNVFKAASSTWMYYFNILAGYDIKYLQRTETQPLQLARKRFPRPELYELLDNLPTSMSFLFAREPFVRIVSAYRNKLEGGRNSYYKALGQRIVRDYRRHQPMQHPPVHGPTFEEFIEFLIAQHAANKRFDEHWAPIYSFCTPCSVNFTIIAKVETFQRDSEFIIRQAGLEQLLLGKLPKHTIRKIGNQAKSGIKTDEMLVIRYFSQIKRNTLDQLLKIYHLDFELFDYDYYKYYNFVQTVFDVTTTATTSTILNTTNKNNNNTLIVQHMSNNNATFNM